MFRAVLMTSACVLAASVSAAEHRRVEVDDYFTLTSLHEIAVSSKAGAVAYTAGHWQESTNDRRTDLWLAPLAGGPPRPLTTDRAGYDRLRWSPDGQTLYFLARFRKPDQSAPPYDGSCQVWALALATGEITSVTEQPGGVIQYELTSDGTRLVAMRSQDFDSGPWASLRSRYPKLFYGTRKEPTTEFSLIELSTKVVSPLARYRGYVDAFSVSPDRRRLGMVTGHDGSVIVMEGRSRITVLDTTTGEATDLSDSGWRTDLPSPSGRLSSPRWSADGQALAFAIGFDAYPSEVFVAQWTGATPTVRKIPRPEPVSLHGGVDGDIALAWQGKTRNLCFLVDDHARVHAYRAVNAPSGGPVEPLTEGDRVVEAFEWDSEGRTLAVIQSHPESFQQVATCVPGSSPWTQLTNLNEHTRDWKLPRMSLVRWQGADGQPVDGVLELPADYVPGKPVPLIVNIHGGPTSAVRYHRNFNYLGGVLFASQGYAYFSPNYRGSLGYGDQFLTQLVGRTNDLDVDDILRGVDFLVAEGICRPDQMAVSGWSNGGYLTNCLISKTNRFQAASSGAGILDQAMEWGTNDEPAYPGSLIGGAPWEVPEAYRRSSPLYAFGNVRTPTVFHVGQYDVRCPRGHSDAAHRILKEFLKVDCELIVYPGEGHGLGTYSSRRAKMAWDLAWFDHYVRGRPIPEPAQSKAPQ